MLSMVLSCQSSQLVSADLGDPTPFSRLRGQPPTGGIHLYSHKHIHLNKKIKLKSFFLIFTSSETNLYAFLSIHFPKFLPDASTSPTCITLYPLFFLFSSTVCTAVILLDMWLYWSPVEPPGTTHLNKIHFPFPRRWVSLWVGQ